MNNFYYVFIHRLRPVLEYEYAIEGYPFWSLNISLIWIGGDFYFHLLWTTEDDSECKNQLIKSTEL